MANAAFNVSVTPPSLAERGNACLWEGCELDSHLSPMCGKLFVGRESTLHYACRTGGARSWRQKASPVYLSVTLQLYQKLFLRVKTLRIHVRSEEYVC